MSFKHLNMFRWRSVDLIVMLCTHAFLIFIIIMSQMSTTKENFFWMSLRSLYLCTRKTNIRGRELLYARFNSSGDRINGSCGTADM